MSSRRHSNVTPTQERRREFARKQQIVITTKYGNIWLPKTDNRKLNSCPGKGQASVRSNDDSTRHTYLRGQRHVGFATRTPDERCLVTTALPRKWSS